MKMHWSIVKWLLIGWGIVCLIGLIVIGGTIGYLIGPGNVAVSDSATKQDVRFVLNECQLGDERIEEVVHSYQSTRGFSGTHLETYLIKISHVDPSELTRDNFGYGWFRCDELDGVLKEAVNFATGRIQQYKIGWWFLTEEELGSSEVFVYPQSIYCHGTQPSAAKLIFVKPKNKMVFYMSARL